MVRRSGPPSVQPGGPPVYVSLAAAPARALPLSVVGYDFPRAFRRRLSEAGLRFRLVRAVHAPTTNFVIRYRDGRRDMRLTCRCEVIESGLKDLTCKIIHLGPVAGEISASILSEAPMSCETLSVDPQGFIRAFRRNGRAYLSGNVPKTLLSKCHIFKGSAEEVRRIGGRSSLVEAIRRIRRMGPEIVMATVGGKGALVLAGGLSYMVPAFTAKEADSTGAGDAFVGGFLGEYLRSGDPIWSAAAGSATASYAVQALGPWGLTSMKDLEDRAQSVYEQTTTLR